MQKKKEEQNAKPVGAGLVPAQNKGITLIALIITIIVMLILVGVTIDVALNGGLFQKAKNATVKTQKELEKELIQLAYSEYKMEKINNPSAILQVQGAMVIGDETSGWEIIFDGVGNRYELSKTGKIEELESSEETKLLKLTYTMSEIEINNKIYGVGIKFNLKARINEETYREIKSRGITLKEKELIIVQALTEEIEDLAEAEETFETLDEITLALLNYSDFGIKHEKLEEWLEEPLLIEAVKEVFEDSTIDSVKKENLNALLYGGFIDFEGKELTNQECIESGYELVSSFLYEEEYEKSTSNLSMYLVNGQETLLNQNLQATIEGIDFANYETFENGIYKFIIKNSDNEIVEEIEIQISNIEKEKSEYIGTKDKWETDGNGTITKYLGTDTNVIVPMYVGFEHITTVDKNVFKENTSLIEITIPSGITRIGENTFEGCKNLDSIIIPDSVSEIGAASFKGCSSLVEITIPWGVSELNDYVFEECTSLKKVNLPETLTYIGRDVFRMCESLESINIPDSVSEIKNAAFYGCSSLVEITIPSGVTILDDHVFYRCTSLQVVNLPETLTYIGCGVFARCEGLESIKIPNSVISIFASDDETHAFYKSDNLKNIYFSKGDNPVPNGRPWGAPADVNIIKLTE